jgi:hypothetical protein
MGKSEYCGPHQKQLVDDPAEFKALLTQRLKEDERMNKRLGHAFCTLSAGVKKRTTSPGLTWRSIVRKRFSKNAIGGHGG